MGAFLRSPGRSACRTCRSAAGGPAATGAAAPRSGDTHSRTSAEYGASAAGSTDLTTGAAADVTAPTSTTTASAAARAIDADARVHRRADGAGPLRRLPGRALIHRRGRLPANCRRL